MPFYEWQRPSPLYKKVLEERQAVLRQCRLDEDDGLLAEWFALVAELDRCLREEHAQQDINPYLASAYYKTVLLARQDQLRKFDLGDDEVLLMEWCMLVRELDAIVQKEHQMEKTAEGQNAVKLLNKATSERRQKQKEPQKEHEEGQSQATAAHQVDADATAKAAAPTPPRPAGLQDLPAFQIDGPAALQTSAAPTPESSTLPVAACVDTNEDDDEAEVTKWLEVDNGADASAGAKTSTVPNWEGMTIAEIAAAGLADPSSALTAAIAAENAAAAMSLESYATLPPSERLKALCTPSVTELDVDATSKSLQALSEWTPPTRVEVEESALPSWLLGDESEEDDEVDMLFGTSSGVAGSGRSFGGSAGGSSASASSSARSGDPLDQRRITELELKRELARKDEELRLVEAQIDLETARKRVERKEFEITYSKNSDEKANLQMELVEAQSELDWRQKECEAVQLKLELHEMERSLEGARIGVLSHPQVGELLDSSDILTRIANESVEPQAVLSIATSIESAVEDSGERGLVLASSNPILGIAEAAAGHNAVVTDKVAADDIEATLALMRTQANAMAAAAVDGTGSLGGGNGNGEGHNGADGAGSVAAGVDVDPAWMEKQLATLNTSQLHRQGAHAKIKESLLKSAENKPERVEMYTSKAADELARQIEKAERRVRISEQEMSAERKRQAQEQADLVIEEEQKQARLRVMGATEGRAENADVTVQKSKLKAAYWSAQIKVLETHIQKKAETMQRMNSFALQATGKRAITLNSSSSRARNSGERGAQAEGSGGAGDTDAHAGSGEGDGGAGDDGEPAWL